METKNGPGITVDLTAMIGEADFTNLNQWSANIPIGETGTGTMWGDGDLSYGIEVRGNTFVKINGDEGSLSGAFLGKEHEAVGGTLKRENLSASFAAQR